MRIVFCQRALRKGRRSLLLSGWDDHSGLVAPVLGSRLVRAEDRGRALIEWGPYRQVRVSSPASPNRQRQAQIMNSSSPSLSFSVDSAGAVELIRSDQPQNIDLCATQPIDIPMANYLAASTSTD